MEEINAIGYRAIYKLWKTQEGFRDNPSNPDKVIFAEAQDYIDRGLYPGKSTTEANPPTDAEFPFHRSSHALEFDTTDGYLGRNQYAIIVENGRKRVFANIRGVHQNYEVGDIDSIKKIKTTSEGLILTL